MIMVSGAVLAALAVMLLRELRNKKTRVVKDPGLNAQADMTHMRLLIQTMRDLLDQQKSLARQLNAALDKKVEYIRQSVDVAMADVETLRNSIQAIAEDVERARVGGSGSAPAGSVPPPNLHVLRRGAQREGTAEGEDGVASVQLIGLPEAPPKDDGVLSSWVGLDLPGEEPDTYAFDVPDHAPEAPEDAEAAREAFRALLLNYESQQEQKEKKAAKPEMVKTAAAKNGDSHNGNGGNGKSVTPIQSRVYEYEDAGMSVAQIAKELGIGKGEVRLILTLRKARDQ